MLQTARARTKGRVIAVMQPHRYTRLHDLFDEFCACVHDADTVLVAPVYAAGEAPIVGADAKALARAIRARGRIDPVLVPNAKALPGVLPDMLHDGDLVILMGAGDIGAVAQELAAKGFDGANRA